MAFRGRRQDARGVVRRPGSAARTPRAAGRRTPHPAGALPGDRARTVPRPGPLTGQSSTPGWCCVAGSSRSSSGSSGSASTWRHTHETTPTPTCSSRSRRRPHSAQPRGDGLDAHRPGGPRVGHRQAGGLLRRARPRRRRPDRHRRLRAQQARLAQAVRVRADHRLQAERHKRVTGAVHDAGGAIALQVLHAGRYGYHPFSQ